MVKAAGETEPMSCSRMGQGSASAADQPAGSVKLCSPFGVVTVTGAAGSGVAVGVGADEGVAAGAVADGVADGVADTDDVAVALFETVDSAAVSAPQAVNKTADAITKAPVLVRARREKEAVNPISSPSSQARIFGPVRGTLTVHWVARHVPR